MKKLNPKKRAFRRRKGTAMFATFGIMTLVSMAGVAYVESATQTMRFAKHNQLEVQTTHLCEAGVQDVLRELWRPFKVEQKFDTLRSLTESASAPEDGGMGPQVVQAGSIDDVGAYAAGVIKSYQSPWDINTQIIVVRSVGWIDRDEDGVLDPGEPSKTVEVTGQFALRRSPIFDYTYFANNYGWFYNFNPNQMIVNGDIRANGDMAFKNGSPTINGTIAASNNEKLLPGATGRINTPPVKWQDSTYEHKSDSDSDGRWRQAYDESIHGAIGSEEFQRWRDLVYFEGSGIDNGRHYGTVMLDSSGTKGWNRRSVSADPAMSVLDTDPSEEIIMPDLQDISYYAAQSRNYHGKSTYKDGQPNPNAVPVSDPGGSPRAYVEVWDADEDEYVEITTDGVAGSGFLVGTEEHPIRINGPVTFEKDVVIKGYVDGQGTIYTGRNIHVIGSVRYTDPPDFDGNDMEDIDHENIKKDMLGLAARKSIFMGDTTNLSSYAKQYMRPPFTKERLDENGDIVPAFDYRVADEWGELPYKSLELEDEIDDYAEGVNQIDAILYTNFLGGGDLGTGGGGFTINGSLITRDEAMIMWSLPARMNYDNRIRERGVEGEPLIDLDLPRSPTILRSTWQDKGLKLN